MKKAKKLVVFLMTFAMVIALGTIASAKAKIEYQVSKQTMNRILGMREGKPGVTAMVHCDKDDKVKASVTSSNNKVAVGHVDEYVDEYGGDIYIDVVPKKPGKTTITIKVTTNGKTTVKTLKYHFAAYQNPFTSFKISGKDKTSQFDKLKKKVSQEKEVYWVLNGKFEAGKISYKVNKRYKIISFMAYREKNDAWKELKITNNFELKKGDRVSMQYKDLKTNTYGYLEFEVS
ncbi:MAG: hypothetical protein ACI4EI_00550 [Muricoprocola sp.]